MTIYVNITGVTRQYVTTGDTVYPVGDAQFLIEASATQALSATHFTRNGNFFSTMTVLDSDIEAENTINTWSIDSGTYYLSKHGAVTIKFWVLKNPVAPTLSLQKNNKTVILTTSTTSLQCYKTVVDWGDGNIDTNTTSTRVFTHTYNASGIYTISVYNVNRRELTGVTATIIANIIDQFEFTPNKTVYLLENNAIVKPLKADIQIIYNAVGSVASLKMPYDAAVTTGKQIYCYGIIPQIFNIESITGDKRTLTVTAVDYLQSLMKSRVIYTNTNQNDGYVTYAGKGGMVIPSIITDNLTPSPRGSANINPPSTADVGENISIKARYNNVGSVLQNALESAKMTLKTTVYAVNPLLINCQLVVPSTKTVNLMERRKCGEMANMILVRQATTALVAGSGTGATRQTAWRGDTSAGILRKEMYVDGGESTETTALATQEGNTINWNLSLDAPYKVYTDFWIGDSVYVEGNLMRLTQVDYAKSSSGETIALTFGRPITGVDKQVTNLEDGQQKRFT